MFLADYSCKIARKPINRAFHGYLWNAKNFGFGRSGMFLARFLAFMAEFLAMNLL